MPAYDLTAEQKAAIITQRLQQFAAEKFQHELNKTTAEAIGDATAAATSVAAIAQLDTAIGVHETELALVAPVVEPVIVEEPGA